LHLGIPKDLNSEELTATIINARECINNEASHTGGVKDPADTTNSANSDSDLASLRAKFPFLKDFSDSFIRANKPDSLMKLETANMKLKEAEHTKDADDKQAHNRTNIGTICVDVGIDDRTSVLHDGRFLPGPNCSAARLWLANRNRTLLHGAPPLGNMTWPWSASEVSSPPRAGSRSRIRLLLDSVSDSSTLITVPGRLKVQRKKTTIPTYWIFRNTASSNWLLGP
jgi:hypothetical protein